MDSPAPTILGFILRDVAGIKPVYIPLEPGLTVLYGQNGAGKTRILNAIDGIWSGSITGAELLIHLPPPHQVTDSEADEDWPTGTLVPSALQLSLTKNLISASYFMEQGLHKSNPRLEDSEPAYLDHLSHATWGDSHPEIFAEFRRQRLAIIRGIGTTDGPRWAWEPAAIVDTDSPALDNEFAHAKELGYPDDYDHDSPIMFSLLPLGDGAELCLAQSWSTSEIEHEGSWMGISYLRPQEGDEAFTKDRLSLVRWQQSFHEIILDSKRQEDGRGKQLSRFESLVGRLWHVSETFAPIVNYYYSSLLLDAPVLEIQVTPVITWWSKPPLAYCNTAGIELADLSRAEQSWARWALAQANAPHDGTPTFQLIDEPEAALHRAAETHMARGLATFSTEANRHVFAASHSPELLNLPSARIFQVRKLESHSSECIPLIHPDREALEELGLVPSDLLRRHRAFLLVEGRHDQVILEFLVGRELDRLRVEILPLRGARNLPRTIESRVLFDFTDAQVVALVDNISAGEITYAWHQAQRVAKVKGEESAGEILRSILGSSSNERQWLAQWLSRALETGREGRVTPFGLERSDVIEYLPVERLVPRSSSWDDLHQEHEMDLSRRKNCPKDFKKWLELVHDASFADEALEEACRGVAPPTEFVDLLTEIAIATGDEV